MGFLNGAEIGYKLDKKCKKIIFYYGKNEKNTGSAQLCKMPIIHGHKGVHYWLISRC